MTLYSWLAVKQIIPVIKKIDCKIKNIHFPIMNKKNSKVLFYIGMRAIVVVIVWQLDLQLHVQSGPITIKVVCSNRCHGKVYSIQHYVTKFVSDLQQVSGFLQVLQFPPPIKMTAMILLKYCLKVALNTINHRAIYIGMTNVMLH